MKRRALVLTLCGLLLSTFGCKPAKEGPFTFTNKTGETVCVLIAQDGTIAKRFDADEKYVGKDYYTPQITFMKNIDTEANKKIIANKYQAATEDGFDYSFKKAEGQKLVITANLGGDFSSAVQPCYLVEASGKMGDCSDTVVTIGASQISATCSCSQAQTTSSATSSPLECRLYTAAPEFRIYRDADRKQDITDLFGLALGESEIPPAASAGTASSGASGQQESTAAAAQWNLEIIYPKTEQIQ